MKRKESTIEKQMAKSVIRNQEERRGKTTGHLPHIGYLGHLQSMQRRGKAVKRGKVRGTHSEEGPDPLPQRYRAFLDGYPPVTQSCITCCSFRVSSTTPREGLCSQTLTVLQRQPVPSSLRAMKFPSARSQWEDSIESTPGNNRVHLMRST